MRAALIVAAASLASCATATDCGSAIPEELRADVYRYVVESELTPPGLMPRDHQTLGLGAGPAFGELSDERRKAVALRAAGYTACLRERVHRLR